MDLCLQAALKIECFGTKRWSYLPSLYRAGSLKAAARELGRYKLDVVKWISRRWDVGVLTGLGWPRIETGGGRL